MTCRLRKETDYEKIGRELVKIEYYTQQVLFYARSSTLEKDYMIVRCDLKDIVNGVIRKYKDALIGYGIRVNVTDAEGVVYTDGKWLGFILGQIIANSIEYMKREPGRADELYISARENRENTELKVRDNGCGIKPGELPRVFDKGLTGTNGRADGRRSTGLGLYLCKRLCDKMNVGIILAADSGIKP